MREADNKIKLVQIGMTKNEVIDIMGNTYEIIAADKDGETLGYRDFSNAIYQLAFVKDRLVRWNKVWFNDTGRYKYANESPRIQTQKEPENNTALKNHLDAHRNALLSGAKSEDEKSSINTHMDAHSKAMLGE